MYDIDKCNLILCDFRHILSLLCQQSYRLKLKIYFKFTEVTGYAEETKTDFGSTCIRNSGSKS